MLTAVRAWILLSALLVADGWVLSALHALNRTGYAVSFAIAAVLLAARGRLRMNGGLKGQVTRAANTFWRRFKRPAPFLYLFMLLLSLAAGLVRLPNNWDTDAYRIPRVLHWLAAGNWHWVHTGDSRMNIAGAGFEWLFAPMLAFIGNDRWLFLINIISYALLPGLIFAFLRQVKVAGRVAWWWTWVLSSGWCFVYQAGSVTNDSLAAIYALAAVVFALRAAERGEPGDWWISILGVALLTGVKQSNLPLALPWAVAAWRARRIWWKRPGVVGIVLVLGLLISTAIPTWLNFKYAGTWSGFPKGAGSQNFSWGKQQELNSPAWGLVGNAFCFPVQNLMPPFLPWAPAWDAMMQRFLQSPLGSHFTQFESFGHLDRSINAGNAGIGLGVVVVTAISVICALRYRSRVTTVKRIDGRFWAIWLAPWLSLAAFLAKVGTYQNARQAAPYYVLLMPLVLILPGQASLVRQWWWRCLVWLVMSCTAAHLTFIYGRELVPASVVKGLISAHPDSKFLSVFNDYYTAAASVKAQRDYLQTNGMPAEKLVGYATTCGASEPGFWIPYGSRRVERVLAGDSPDQLRAQNMHYVVVEDMALAAASETIDQWTGHYHGEVVNQLTCKLNPAAPPIRLYLVHLQP